MERLSFNLRKVTPADCRRIWEWTNDHAMLRFAFQTTSQGFNTENAFRPAMPRNGITDHTFSSTRPR